MTDFLFESEQGDPGTVEDANLDRLRPIMPRRLFALWETHQWAATTLDFTRDRQDWLGLHEEQRAMLVRSMAPFFACEARVAEVLAPIILAPTTSGKWPSLRRSRQTRRDTQFFSKGSGAR